VQSRFGLDGCLRSPYHADHRRKSDRGDLEPTGLRTT